VDFKSRTPRNPGQDPEARNKGLSWKIQGGCGWSPYTCQSRTTYDYETDESWTISLSSDYAYCLAYYRAKTRAVNLENINKYTALAKTTHHDVATVHIVRPKDYIASEASLAL